jgi:hypothetical protein
MAAPVDSVKSYPCATAEMEEENNRRVAAAAELRRKKIVQYRPDWITAFLPDEPDKAREYMSVLPEKDRQDANPEVLMEHYEESLVYENQYPREIFLSYIWNPRVEFEILTRWRRSISGYFSQEQKDRFLEDPKEIWHWIQTHIRSREDRERETVYITPAAALQLGFAQERSKKVLFVAIARTLGIPARLNPVDASAEYWNDGEFVRVIQEKERGARVIFTGEKDFSWNYFQNWSVAKLSPQGYQSLKLWDVSLQDGRLELAIEPGEYRLLTSNRLPSGNIFAKRYDFQIEKGECRTIELQMREASLADMLDSHSIPDHELTDLEGNRHLVGELTKDGRHILFWLEVSKEPTEHILNELMEMRERFAPCQDRLLFIVRKPEDLNDPTLSKCRNALPEVRVFCGDFGKNLEMTARRMYVAPDKLPLLVVTEGGATGMFAASGYSVGMADMLMRVLNS